MTELIRIEKDSLGAVEVPKDVLWGAQTQRSLKNFAVQGDIVPIEIVYSLAKIKQASAAAIDTANLSTHIAKPGVRPGSLR